MKGYYDCGYTLLTQGVGPDDRDDWDEDEHPITCICPECAYYEWLIYQGEDRQDPLDDENYTPPY